MKSFYSQFISKGDLCFDVGANVGNRTEIFLSLGAYVVVVEPQATCMQALKTKFTHVDRVFFQQKALGENDGEGQLLISNTNVLSSMSESWIEKVKQSGRFKNHEWNKTERIEITTLDSLISQYGLPVFCKIDVEGYEFEVVKGLSQPIPVISFEFTPEFITETLNVIHYLSSLGSYQFNFSYRESMILEKEQWVDSQALIWHMQNLPEDPSLFGDAYARIIR